MSRVVGNCERFWLVVVLNCYFFFQAGSWWDDAANEPSMCINYVLNVQSISKFPFPISLTFFDL